MKLLERAHIQRKRRQAFSGRPIVLSYFKPYQRYLDRVWPGVVLAFNPELEQFVLQDRRTKSPRGWYVVMVMEPYEWPTLDEFARHLQDINTSGIQTEWDYKRWYDKEMREPDEQMADLNARSFYEAMIRETAEKMGRIVAPRPFVPFMRG